MRDVYVEMNPQTSTSTTADKIMIDDLLDVWSNKCRNTIEFHSSNHATFF